MSTKQTVNNQRKPLAEIADKRVQMAQQKQRQQLQQQGYQVNDNNPQIGLPSKVRAQKLADVAAHSSSLGSSSFSTTTTSSSSFSSSSALTTFASRFSSSSNQFSLENNNNNNPLQHSSTNQTSSTSSSPPLSENTSYKQQQQQQHQLNKTLTSLTDEVGGENDVVNGENLSSSENILGTDTNSEAKIAHKEAQQTTSEMVANNQSSNREAVEASCAKAQHSKVTNSNAVKQQQNEICTNSSSNSQELSPQINTDKLQLSDAVRSNTDATISEPASDNNDPPSSNGKNKQQKQQIAAQQASSSTSGPQQQRQMFSFKQLALNSRNLTKKRGSIQRGPSGAFARLFEPVGLTVGTSSPQDNNSSSNSSAENSCISDNNLAATTASADSSAQQNRKQSIAGNQVQRKEQRLPDDLSDDYEISDDEDDDADYYDDDDDGGDEDCLDEDSGSGGENCSSTAATATTTTTTKKRRRKRDVSNRRRLSDCNCDRIATKIDCDGLPVTDVDLVTYKDLCQMEQAHHMRTNRPPQRQPSSSGQYSLKPSSAGSNLRRSSLQEESGAYYQLCTTNEEQNIRRKYLWFPPSLRQLELVDKFFAAFPKDKIPLVPENPSSSTSTSGGGKPVPSSNDEQQPTTTTVAAAAAPTTSGNNISNNKPPQQQHPAVGFYRDEQISFQLPRQDISLDYCSYQMDEASRLAYGQFVERRNSHALDVGNVVQVRISLSKAEVSIEQPTTTNTKSTRSNRLATFHRSGSQTPIESRPIERQRKASTISQSAAMSALIAFNQQQQQQPSALQLSNQQQTGPQRCRRCLVRFENQQLAVVAPNFIIGSALYHPDQNPPPQSPPIHITNQDLAELSRFGPNSSKAQQQKQQQQQQSDPPPNAALFHPTCFTCSTCKEFLVDLVYCLRDNKLYCLRHYGESLRPRCNWCQELIFSDEYLKAMNESFHVDHFMCRHCDSNLAGQRYVLKEEKPFCIQCYEGNFANTCEDCHKPIGIDSRDLSYKDRHWHDKCFICNKCQQSLIDKPFGSKSEKVYCAECYEITFATRCDGCKNPFRAGSKKMEYRGRQWHDNCFCCCICSQTIGSNSFIPKNDEIYCIKCYEHKYATRCTKCKQVIVSGGVTFRNEPWHRECFNCCNCNKSLAGQRFTTRDVTKETVFNTNKTNQPHNAYCIDCYGELFAKKCHACLQAITGLGGTRFVTFEDRSWHSDCFLCNDCNVSLVGKGFITDGPESILCGECARAKLR